jgi:subfamily B ATP-binding cassette protein MsbA
MADPTPRSNPVTVPGKRAPIKKLSRKSVANLSTSEFLSAAKAPMGRLLSHVKPYRGRFILGILIGVFYGLFNAVVIFGMKFVFEMVLPSDKTRETIPLPFIGQIQVPKPQLTHEDGIWLVLLSCGLIPLLILIRGLLGYFNSYCMLWVGQKVLYDLRSQTFSKLMHHSLRFYSRQKTGELIQTVFNQTRMVATVGSDLAANLIKHPISILTYVVSILWLDWRFAIAALVVFPLCMLPVIFISQKVRQAGGKEEEEAGQLMVTMHEAFAGIRVVKSLSREAYEIQRFNRGSALLEKLVMRWKKAVEIVGPMVETVASMGIALGLAYAWYVKMPASNFLILYAALIAIYPHAKSLSQLQVMLQKCLVAATKVFEIQDQQPDVADIPEAVPLGRCRGEIEFREISFSYKKGIPAVQGINLKMEAGKRYALVGQSGAGKSTLFALLLRFYDPDEGHVLVDGQDIRAYTQTSLRENIGIVNQDTFLFHDTIYENIRYGKLDATKEEIEEAARKAHAHDFILAQEKGYETVIGDKGSNLSGGQQQRLSIARAFVRSAPILLLDEATSALDSEAERHIQDAIDALSQGRTVIAIAHRLSTILSADAIVMMEKGRVIAVGSHTELLHTCPEYQHLYHLQFEAHNGQTGESHAS